MQNVQSFLVLKQKPAQTVTLARAKFFWDEEAADPPSAKPHSALKIGLQGMGMSSLSKCNVLCTERKPGQASYQMGSNVLAGR